MAKSNPQHFIAAIEMIRLSSLLLLLLRWTPRTAIALVANSQKSCNRRSLMRITASGLLPLLFLPPEPCFAGEIGAKITKAVTTSEIGISVRRSVVKGAQIMDRLDQQAERFSDRFQLGSERAQQDGRPRPKVIPPAQPLDTEWARTLLEVSDRNFCRAARVRPERLDQTVLQTAEKLRPSFKRAGVDMTSSMDGDQFNFACYVHYKSYLELLLSKNDDFATFKRSFEQGVAQEILLLLLLPTNREVQTAPTASSSSSRKSRQQELDNTLGQVDNVLSLWVEKGLIAQIEQSAIDEEDVIDWSKHGLADLSWSVAIDGDITLASQLLLQEQGYRFYPNYVHLLVQYILQQGLPGQDVTLEDYYLDTDYNSDPDKFEVKEVLINVNIESS